MKLVRMLRSNWLLVCATLCVVSLVAVYFVFREEARGRLLDEARASALLYAQALRAELDRRRHLPETLAIDEDFAEAALGGDATALNRQMEALAATTEAEAIYLLDATGLTVAASNWNAPDTFLGQRYEFREYFRAAIEGETGIEFAIGATTGRPGVFVSSPVHNDDGAVVGALVVKIDLAPLSLTWDRQRHEVLLLNDDGVVVLTGRPGWRFRTTRELSPLQLERIEAGRQFAGLDLSRLNLLDLEPERVTLDGTGYLRVALPVDWQDWRLWLLAPDRQASAQALASTAHTAVAMLVVLTALAFARSEWFRSALNVSQRERSELSQLNADLNREIEERRLAESELRAAQSELRRAAKLTALGQLAASVTHELGQPLSAMKTYIRGAQRESARNAATTERTLERLDRLVDRISGIAQQLRFFARRGGEAMGPVDLREVVAGAGETMEPALEEKGASLIRDLPDRPVTVTGGQRRLEQVLVNLIRNALDASDEMERPTIRLTVTALDGNAVISVTDEGHGVSPDLAATLFEPFATTRASGEGMGLGLAISASIVQEHGGSIEAASPRDGGAEFIVTLPLAEEGEEARG